MKYLILSVFLFFLMVGFSHAQSEQKDSKGYVNSRGYEEGATYGFSAGSQKGKKNKKVLGIFKNKSKSPYSFDEKVKEYEELMEANAKKYKKMAKDMEKPKYSDPTYFGHKKKPKKRSPGKRKLCKECGIVH